MSYGPISVYQGTIASAATLSGEIDLTRAYKTVYLAVPSMTSNTQIFIKASDATGGTFRRVKHSIINQASPTSDNDFAIASSTTNAIVAIPNGLRYLKIETTATVDSGQAFKIICSD